MKICVIQREGIRHFTKFAQISERDKIEVELQILGRDDRVTKTLHIDLTSALLDAYADHAEVGRVDPAAPAISSIPVIKKAPKSAKVISPAYLTDSKKEKDKLLAKVHKAQAKHVAENRQKQAERAAARAERLAEARKIKAEKEALVAKNAKPAKAVAAKISKTQKQAIAKVSATITKTEKAKKTTTTKTASVAKPKANSRAAAKPSKTTTKPARTTSTRKSIVSK